MSFRCIKAFLKGGLVVIVLSLSAQGVAREGGGHPCKGDIESFCKGIHPGEGPRRDCLKRHETELSPKCQSYVAHYWRSDWGVCELEVQLYCHNVKGGHSRIRKCLKEQESQLSDACRHTM